MRTKIALSGVLLVALVITSVALAAPTTTLEVKAVPNKASKSKKKLTPIRLTINVTFADAAAAQPPPLRKVTIRFNEGGTYNGKLFPKCKGSALELKGPSACPKGSKIGKGSATASAQPVIPLVNATITLFNGEPKGGSPTVLIYAVPDISSPITIAGTVTKKSSVSCAGGTGKCDYVLEFPVPDIPTLPGQPNASVLTTKTTTDNVFIKKKKKVKGKKKRVKIPLIGAPVKCTGKWVADSTVEFADGSTATAQTSTACKK